MSDSKTYKVLLVDDDPEVLQKLHGILFEQGYSVFIARNGRTAINTAREKMPDLILLDINMPVMDGFEVFRELKSIPETSEILVIIMSEQNEPDSVLRGLAMGAVDYITKPFVSDQIVPRISNHLALKARGDYMEEEKNIAEMQLTNHTKMFTAMTSDLLTQLDNAEVIVEQILINENLPSPDVIRQKLEDVKTLVHNSHDQLEKMEIRSKIINNEIVAENRKFDLDGTLKNCVRRYMQRAKRKGITLLYENPGPKPVFADLSLVSTIIKNLLSNAINFTASGGDIIVNAHPYELDSSYILVTVYDTGVGMDAEKTARIFDEKALYADDDNSRPGLGLGIANHFVKLCGGKIWVESMPGIGSDFKFILPIAK